MRGPVSVLASSLTRSCGACQSDDSESSDEEDDDDAPEDDADGSQGDDDEEDDDDGSRSGSGRDAGDWYDVDDGFIDDSEFQDAAEERKAKRNGFFINKVRCALCPALLLMHAQVLRQVSVGRD
jgi:hypothetical protein